ncbi:hypothetical protein PTTG_28905 [Puccinia triticina 1-1 BBBD Race 1]|uniref:Uncharacterized protein n=1 Tax=Puccinia triticina (isolate 1-1 / race 1 (BBBD)) TaxID=630390 RepID=A0A180G8E0_PUCT1|nr:hypothetical protein PTTG_28905 [Puccinia triticina 1-1 BBBD Race 1]
MVALTITPKHGNHTRYFPHAGFLGLSPVILAGHVHTRLEEDNQPLEASRLVVRIRCYEAVGSTLSKGTRPELPDSFNKLSNLNVLWQTEQTLWAARSSAGYEPLGDSNRPWKLTIPTHAVDPTHNSNAQQSCPAIGSITYKTWRSWWQVETVIYHKPAGIMGSKLMKSHPLYLINYREAEKYYSSPEEPTTTIQSSNSRIRYSITSPTAVCCGDEIQIKILIGTKPPPPPQQQQQQQHPHHHSPAPATSSSSSESSSGEPELILKRLQVSLVRRLAIELFKPSPSSTQPIPIDHKPWRLARHLANPALRPINPFASASAPSPSSILTAPLSSEPLTTPTSNSTPHSIALGSNLNAKRQFTTVNTLITNTEGISKSVLLNHLDHHQPHPSLLDQHQPQHPPARYEYGFLVKLKVPLVKSKSHYSIGETCKTNLATVNFSFQFKLSIKNKVTNRLETIDLSELNVDVFSISKAEIQGALGQLKKISGSGSATPGPGSGSGGGGGGGGALAVPPGSHPRRPSPARVPPAPISLTPRPHHLHHHPHSFPPVASLSSAPASTSGSASAAGSKPPSPNDRAPLIPPFVFPRDDLSPPPVPQ